MNTSVKVARYLSASPMVLALPWMILTLVFAINVLIVAGIPSPPGTQHYVGALSAVYVLVVIYGAMMTYRNLPAALALGVSRHSLYTGTALFFVVQAAVSAVALTVLQLIERATGGWGIAMHFFRVPYLFDGPWYLTLLTSFVGLTLMGVWGIWFGLVYHRWNLIGLLGFSAGQVFIVALIIVIAARVNAWTSIAHFFTTLTIAGLTGVLAALAVVLLAGGYTTVRRVTV